MNIVFISRVYLPHLGGVETHIQEISAVLLKMGHTVSVVTCAHDSKLSQTATIEGVRVYRMPLGCGNHKRSLWREIVQYTELFAQADIVHVHDVFWWILPCYVAIKNKVYTTFHGWETKLPIAVNAKIHRFLAAKLSQGTIHVGDFIQKFYYDIPSVVTYGGVNLKRFTKAGSVLPKNKKNGLSFVFVGRLEKDTDVELYLNFFELLARKKIPHTVVWVGDGSLKNECEKVGTVTGFVKNTSQYILQADFVCASSYLSILEAQSLQKIVCAFYSNPVKKAYLELFPGAGYMLVASSVENMLAKLEHVTGSKVARSELELQAKKFAQSQSWQSVVAKYMRVWQKAV